jgi:glucan phosphoethanolaminetransferase (alkaline phosphatase superfamily)
MEYPVPFHYGRAQVSLKTVSTQVPVVFYFSDPFYNSFGNQLFQ